MTRVKLEGAETRVTPVLTGAQLAHVLITTTGTQSLYTADEADQLAAMIVRKAAEARAGEATVRGDPAALGMLKVQTLGCA